MIVSIQDAGLHIKRWVFGLFSGARPGQHLPVKLFSADAGGMDASGQSDKRSVFLRIPVLSTRSMHVSGIAD